MLDPDFDKLSKPAPNPPAVMALHINDQREGQLDITLDWFFENWVPHQILSGRAGNVFPAIIQKFASRGDLVSSYSGPKNPALAKPDRILKIVYGIAEYEPTVQ